MQFNLFLIEEVRRGRDEKEVREFILAMSKAPLYHLVEVTDNK